MKPAFQKDGTVTAGNASGINDGAAALVVASEERARLMELAPMAKIVSYATAGVDPRYMGLGPVPAIERALEKADLSLKDIDLFELNEAFAAQSLAVIAKLGLDSSQSQCQRWRNRAWSSDRRKRRANPGHAALRDEEARCAARTCGALHRRRAGNRDDRGEVNHLLFVICHLRFA